MASNRAIRHRDLVYAYESAGWSGSLTEVQRAKFKEWLLRDLEDMSEEDSFTAAILNKPSHKGVLIDLPIISGLPVRLMLP